MAAAYQAFTSTRVTVPDLIGLTTALRALGAAELGVVITDPQHYVLKKRADWSAADIAAAQAVLDTYVPATAQILAQRAIDAWPIELRALVLALVDQLNVLRAALPSPLQAITPAMALATVRAKAATL